MIEGFFTQKEISSASRPDGKSYTCVACGLYKECVNAKIKPFGKFKKGILNIGEAPGEYEDKAGKPWQGKAGKLLERAYKELGIDLFDDCLNINAVNCRPTDKEGHNRAPSNFEVECCRKSILKTIEEYKPKLIILLGNSAVYSLIGHRWKKDLGGITKWRGWRIPDQDFNTWICPTFHPSYIERSFFESGRNVKQSSVEEVIWKQDLKNIFNLPRTPFPKHLMPQIDIIEDLSVLRKKSLGGGSPLAERVIAFDYETTGIKPHQVGHRIICCSVADSENHAYVFFMPKSKKERQPFIDLLTNPEVGKIAQNMKFEQTWTKVRLNTDVQNWRWDTMLATHIFDNRPGITSLKFQVYVQFGIVDYSSELDPYLRPTDSSSANSLNKIIELIEKPKGREQLLKYCALDGIYEYRLAIRQILNLLPF